MVIKKTMDKTDTPSFRRRPESSTPLDPGPRRDDELSHQFERDCSLND
jgi:hypothetical protein